MPGKTNTNTSPNLIVITLTRKEDSLGRGLGVLERSFLCGRAPSCRRSDQRLTLSYQYPQRLLALVSGICCRLGHCFSVLSAVPSDLLHPVEGMLL